MRIDNHNGVALVLPASDIPHYTQLALGGYTWVDFFLRARKIQEEIDELGKERAGVLALPVSKSEFIKMAKKSLADLQRRAEERLRRYLADPRLWQTGAEPFADFAIWFIGDGRETTYVPQWAEVESAIRTMPGPDDGIADTVRMQRIEKTDSKIAKLTGDLRDCCPLAYVTWRGVIVEDVRLTFVAYWRDLQSQLSAACGPRALTLDCSPEAERRAWEKLGLASFVDKTSKIAPNSGD